MSTFDPVNNSRFYANQFDEAHLTKRNDERFMTVWIKLNRLTPLTLIGSRNSLRKDFTEIAEIVSFFLSIRQLRFIRSCYLTKINVPLYVINDPAQIVIAKMKPGKQLAKRELAS